MKNWMRVYPFYFLIIQYFFLPSAIFSSPGQSEGKFSLQFLYSSRAMPWIWRAPNWSYTKFNIFIIKTIRCVVCIVFSVHLKMIRNLVCRGFVSVYGKSLPIRNTKYWTLKTLYLLKWNWLPSCKCSDYDTLSIFTFISQTHWLRIVWMGFNSGYLYALFIVS